jgi:hypothetical protein
LATTPARSFALTIIVEVVNRFDQGQDIRAYAMTFGENRKGEV